MSGLIDLGWWREGYSEFIDPETWIYASRQYGGDIYAKVVFDPIMRRWHWHCFGAASHGFVERDDAMTAAMNYLRTHQSQVKPINR